MAWPNSMGMKKCRGYLQVTQRFTLFPLIYSLLGIDLSQSYLLFRKDFTYFSSQLDITFDHLRIPIITWYDESGTENTSPEVPDENVTSPNPNSWRIEDAENPNDSINHFVRRLAKYFASTLREFICAISFSVQHYPPYYQKNLIMLIITIVI